ncbi:branched chain amino acid aminotransferase [Dongia mobilis]|uniref:Branched-chain-amino-acid aminotransferase n=1 Tax=Dongia mobilis TaxID=578943 RepID=A0A4R6WSC8_9PROT|nr:branched-chain amino acid aminotransferase [Dongia mobilis]TDQ82381.1 branched chain amino acid aminotransferase [Dongia mobilis]
MSLVPFDDRDGEIWMDGKFIPWREAKLHVLTHSLHYASAVFEGERSYNGKVFKSRQHTERLHKSAEIVGYRLPFSVDEIEAAKTDLVKRTGFQNCYVRAIAWRGSEMMGVSAQQNKIHVAIAAWEWPSYFSPELLANGIRLKWAKYKRPAPDTAPTAAKASGLYQICTISKHEAEQEGFQDAMMLDYRGLLAEATGANVFLVQNGELHTPKPDCFLNGLTRQTVIELAQRRQIKVIERAIQPEELGRTDEVFLVGSAAEVTPVGQIGEYKFKVGPLTRQMREDYLKEVGA